MKRIAVYFTFNTVREANVFRRSLIDSHWLEEGDEADSPYDVVVEIDSGNYQLLGKLSELACDAKACWQE